MREGLPSFAVKVKNLRKQRGLSAQALSDCLQIMSRGVIANLESGRKRDLTVSEVLALAHALGVSAYEIVPELDPVRSERDAALRRIADQLNGVM